MPLGISTAGPLSFTASLRPFIVPKSKGGSERSRDPHSLCSQTKDTRCPAHCFSSGGPCCCLKLSKDGAAGFPEQCLTRTLLTVQGEHRACPKATVAPGGTQGGMLYHYYCCPSFLSRAPLAVSKGRSICGAMVTHLHLAHQLPSNLRGTEHLPQAPGTHVGGRPCWASKHASLTQGPAGLRHFCNLGGLIYSPCFTFACLLLSGPKRTGTGCPPMPHLPT